MDGVLEGFVTVDPKTGYLDQIVVAPEFWGSNVAGAAARRRQAHLAGAARSARQQGQRPRHRVLRKARLRMRRRRRQSGVGPPGQPDALAAVTRSSHAKAGAHAAPDVERKRNYSPLSSDLPPSCLSLANTAAVSRSSLALAAAGRLRLGRLRRRGGDRGGQQRHAGVGRRRLLLRGALHLEVEIDLRAQAERHRIERLRLAAFQWVRSRMPAMVDLVVPTSRMICASLSSG